MTKTYLVMRNVQGAAGSLTVLVKAFDNEAEAQKLATLSQNEFLQLTGTQLVFPPKGKAGDHGIAQATGVSLKDFLGSIGVEHVSHFVRPMEVHAADIVTPVAPVIHLA